MKNSRVYNVPAAWTRFPAMKPQYDWQSRKGVSVCFLAYMSINEIEKMQMTEPSRNSD